MEFVNTDAFSFIIVTLFLGVLVAEPFEAIQQAKGSQPSRELEQSQVQLWHHERERQLLFEHKMKCSEVVM